MKNNIVLIGMPGSGKTTISKMLSEKLNMEVLDTDLLMWSKMIFPLFQPL